MKLSLLLARMCVGALSIVAVVFWCGCASSGSSKQAAAAEVESATPPAKLKKTEHLQGAWVKSGFKFAGRPALTIEPTVFKAEERKNEVAMRAFAVKELRYQLARVAQDTGIFSSIRADDSAASGTTDAPALRLVNTIIEYEKGGGGARYAAGLFGAGQPVLKVRGEMFDSSNNLVFVYEVRRSGEKAASRLVGVFRSDEEIQREDIHDLAIDVTDFMMITAGLQPPKR